MILKRNQTAIGVSFSEDVFTEVLKRLPVSSLIKLIKIERYRDEKGKPRSNFVYVHVYSLSTNSWKTFKKNKFTGYENLGVDSVVVNGAAYWIGTTDQLKVTICFDIENEIIREIMLPPKCSKDIDNGHVILVQKSSSLSLFYIDFSNGRNLSIWLLENEAEINDVWTKKFTLDLDKFGGNWSWWPRDYWNNDEIILMKDPGCGGGFMSYDIKKDEPTEVMDDLSNLCSAIFVIQGADFILASVFVESLALLGDN